MAFNARELSVLAYANGFTLWHYRTSDSAECLVQPEAAQDQTANGYFAAAGELLRPGDQIIVNLLDGDRPRIMNLVVTATTPVGVAVD